MSVPGRKLVAGLALSVALSAALADSGPRTIELAIGALSAPGFAAKAIRLELVGADLTRANLRIGELQAFQRQWRDVTLTCAAFRLQGAVIACDSGRLEPPFALPLSFNYHTTTGALTVVASPSGRERWQAELTGQGAQRRAVLRFADAPVARIQAFTPELPVKFTAGVADGVLRASLGDPSDVRLDGEATLRKIAFSDAPGMRAGEGISGKVTVRADMRGETWQWRLDASWPEGEIFWDPVYSKAGYRLLAGGVITPKRVDIEQATLLVDGLGEIRLNGALDRMSGDIERAQIDTGKVGVAPLYMRFLKPMLRDTAFAELRSEGVVRATLEWRAGSISTATVDLDNVSFEDERGRFAVFGVFAHLPWQRAARTEGRIGLSGAELQRLPIGAVGATLDIEPDEMRAAQLTIPILSGLLTLNDLRLRHAPDGFAWQVRGALSPVPLDVLLAHFGLPAMQGSIAGEIPRVRYERSTLTVDGALLMRVFDGTVTIADLRIDSPLGLAPRLQASLDARNLDLGLVTRTFAFGNITGKVDARVANLVLSNWRPVRFDARIESSPGDYPKRISQTAVSSISALGGAGAATAIQRSVLRFFETFGYSTLGLSCALHDGVCRMGGVEDTVQGYVIVKGGGVPAINVLGYNREVGWEELLTRLKRVLDSNVKPTIQ
jgi:hypothetical protein